jgi:hypothetical protein
MHMVPRAMSDVTDKKVKVRKLAAALDRQISDADGMSKFTTHETSEACSAPAAMLSPPSLTTRGLV